jgi:hypothetical protein
MKRRQIRFVLEAMPVYENRDWKGRPPLTLKRASEITGVPCASLRASWFFGLKVLYPMEWIMRLTKRRRAG